MQIVIEIDDDMYKQIMADDHVYVLDDVNILLIENAIYNGTPLPKNHGRLIDADRVEDITWDAPSYNDALNVLKEVRDKVRALPAIIEAEVQADAE